LNAIPPCAHQPGETLHGFEVIEVGHLESLRAVGYQLRHIVTHARLIHIHTQDTENLFSISFSTPPTDNTGLPHILEHSVLAGSEKFPVKEPFFEMIKMSMATFINAMTGSDMTYYPVSSNNHQDLFNLADVYFDAVFHPQLTENTFLREAHHLEPLDPSAPTGTLDRSGIVFSEMKGVYSHPESLLSRICEQQLFPDTIYGLDSGGDPAYIPTLTHQDLKRYHETMYCPSNAFFFLYGDIPTRDYLAFLESRLHDFSASDRAPLPQKQPRWQTPRSWEGVYPLGTEESEDRKTFLLMSWIVGDGRDLEDVIVLGILDRVLLGHEAAPLRKALIDSGLGEDLTHSGLHAGDMETSYHIGLKGSDSKHREAFEALVMDTLRDLAQDTLDPEAVKSAFQQCAYEQLEIKSMFPLRLMLRTLARWPYVDSPFDALRLAEQFDSCRQRYEKNPSFLNELIRARFLDNSHRLTIVLKPSCEELERQEAKYEEEMFSLRKCMTDQETAMLAEKTARLLEEARQPNPPEAIACLPQLKVSDLPARPKEIPVETHLLHANVELLRNDVFANGVNYLILNFDLKDLSEDLYPYLPRYSDAICKMGVKGQSYERVARRTAAHTGGIGASLTFQRHGTDSTNCMRRLRISLKALDQGMEDALDLLRDLLFGLDPRDERRLKDVTTQALCSLEMDLVNNGLGTALNHATRGLTPEGHLIHEIEGLPQLHLLRKKCREFETEAQSLMEAVEGIRDVLLSRGQFTVSFTGSDSAFDTTKKALTDWTSKMLLKKREMPPLSFRPWTHPPREGLAAPMKVAYCAWVMPAPHISHPDDPFLSLGTQMMSMDYLLPEIRFRGNAYGAACQTDGFRESFAMHSFRDPNPTHTLQVFQNALNFVRNAPWSQEDVDRAIIARVKDVDRNARPSEATILSLERHITGITPAFREERYARILRATPILVKNALTNLLENGMNRASTCVVSSRSILERINENLDGPPLAIEDILTE